MKKDKLSTEPYKGVRDFYPGDLAVQNYIFNQARKVIKSYGYQEYNGSVLEESALYRAKTGEEIVNEQTYNFVDRGGREVTLRPEMTPSVARMIARKRQELVFPLRWFNIGSRYRYEKPQRGRQREFWQIDVDCFGLDNLMADGEIIKIARDILRSFGAKEETYEIRINSRRLMNWFMTEKLGLDNERSYRLAKLIDRREKMPGEEFLQTAGQLVGEKIDDLEKFLEVKRGRDLVDLVGDNAARELVELLEILEKRGINNCRFDPSLMRGFDYYTGVVFEIFDVDPLNKRSLFGGGRYDNLVGIFDAQPVSGVGFGSGDVTLRDFLETHNLLPKELLAGPDYYICVVGEKENLVADRLAEQLRRDGVVEVDYSGQKIGKQMKTADRKKAKKVIVIGEDEVRNKIVNVKDMISGEEMEMGI